MGVIKTEAYFIGMDISMNGSAIVILNRKREIVDYIKYEYHPKKKIYKVKTLKKSYDLKLKSKEYRAIVFTKDAISFMNPYLNKSKINLEGYNYDGIGKVFDIAEFTGYLKLQLLELGYEIDCLTPPTTLKKLITGFGTAEKDSVEKALELRYGMNLHDHDLNDALSLALIIQGNLE